jgi:hypothetical protein
LFQDEIDAMRKVVEQCAKSDQQNDIRTRLLDVRQILSLWIRPEDVDPDGWSKLDELESFFAIRLDGIIHAPGEGFFSSDLRPIPLFLEGNVILPLSRPH